MKACAPGKIIICGEHSVIYGARALAVAVKRYTRVSFRPITESNTINTLFAGISSGRHFPLNALGALKDTLDKRFNDFLQGHLPIQQVLSHPDELLIYTLSALMHHIPVPGRLSSQSYLPMPGRLVSESELPIGAGMGSSASSIAATLVLFEHLLDKPLGQQKRYEMVRLCERLQHGKGSALDAAAVTYGGLNSVQESETQRLETHLGPGWYWIFTGTPDVTTGECVQHVRQHHGQDSQLWQDFSQLSNALIKELQEHHVVIDLIRENHRLLQRIGVVPAAAAELITRIEALGGAAKISGAGASKGETAGLVLAYLPCLSQQELARQLPGWQWHPLEEDRAGACYVGD